MEEVVEGENLKEAWKRVRANKGSPGVEGMTVHALPEYLKEQWPALREQLLSGTYKPQPVRRKEIAKPDGGGVRKLGIPTVLDRLIQQAVMQVLQRRWDPTFSEHSYGFRPRRSAHQAVAQAQQYLAAGYRWVVDLDLEKFFDRVNHDKLMGQVAKRVADKRGAETHPGVLERWGDGERVGQSGGRRDAARRTFVATAVEPGAGRTGPGVGAARPSLRALCGRLQHLRAQRAGGAAGDGERKRFITERLKLKVNQAKSAVARPQRRKFLGFSFTWDREPRRRIAPKAAGPV